jgi:hypothetical protein
MKSFRWMLVVVGCSLAVPTIASGQDIDPQARAAARGLVEEGDKLWAQGDYKGALDRFTRAHGLVNAPTIGIREAECLEKLGRLVEAAEKYMAISRLTLEAGAPDAFRRAVATALERAEGVRERFAILELTIEGKDVEGARVLVDGREIPSALVGASFPVDPGERVIEVVKGNRKVRETVTIGEKESKTLALTLPEGVDEPVVPPVEPAPQPGQPEQPPPPVTMESSSQPTWGWITLGVGAAGLAVGGATGLIAMGQRGTLDDSCVDKKCPPAQKSDVDGYNQMRMISTIGFGVGAVGVVAGVTLLLTSPDPQPREQVGVRPWVGLGSAGVEGTF